MTLGMRPDTMSEAQARLVWGDVVYDLWLAARRAPPSTARTRCACPFGVLLGDCPEHGYLVPEH
jgi:hypothetical protein